MKIPCPFAGSILIFLIIFILVSFSVFLEIIGILLFLVSRIISLWLIICKSPARKFWPRDSKWSKWPNYIPTRFKLFYENSRLKLFIFSFWSNSDPAEIPKTESPTPASKHFGKKSFCLIVTVRRKGEDNCSRANTEYSWIGAIDSRIRQNCPGTSIWDLYFRL